MDKVKDIHGNEYTLVDNVPSQFYGVYFTGTSAQATKVRRGYPIPSKLDQYNVFIDTFETHSEAVVRADLYNRTLHSVNYVVLPVPPGVLCQVQRPAKALEEGIGKDGLCNTSTADEAHQKRIHDAWAKFGGV